MKNDIETDYKEFLLASTIKFIQTLKIPTDIADRTFVNLDKYLVDHSRYEDIELLKKVRRNYENNNKTTKTIDK